MNEFVLNLALHDKRQRSNAHDHFPLLRTKLQIFKTQEEWMLSTQQRTIHLSLTESSDPRLSPLSFITTFHTWLPTKLLLSGGHRLRNPQTRQKAPISAWTRPNESTVL